MSEQRWQDLAERIWHRAEAGEFSGAVLVTVGDREVLHACHGPADRANGIPVTERTRFALASMSKMFTAVAVLIAMAAKGIDVHTLVADLLPAERRPRTLDPGVTVHHLLTHTSGMGDYAEEDEDLPGYVDDYGSLWVDRPVSAMLRPDDFLPMYADAPLVAAPGEAFHYCNAGFVLLGALLEEVTGREFVDVVTDTVLRAAGMADSGYFRSDEARPDLAIGYLPPETPEGPWRSNVFSVPIVGGGDGGAVCTARDIDRFLRALHDGRLLGPDLTAQMLRRHVLEEGDLWMGYGVFVGDDGRFGHGGGDPGVGTWSRLWPGFDVGVVILSNLEGSVEAVWDETVAAVEGLRETIGT